MVILQIRLEPIALHCVQCITRFHLGEEIIIEERSPKELLNTRGGLGEQVAASGIDVWNPAFDVTPAHLISGIITEKGVVTKTGSESFNIKEFVQKTAGNLA